MLLELVPVRSVSNFSSWSCQLTAVKRVLQGRLPPELHFSVGAVPGPPRVEGQNQTRLRHEKKLVLLDCADVIRQEARKPGQRLSTKQPTHFVAGVMLDFRNWDQYD